MAIKVSELIALVTPKPADLLYFSDSDSAPPFESKKMTYADLLAGIQSSLIFTNLYNTDDQLTGVRNVDQDGFLLNFNDGFVGFNGNSSAQVTIQSSGALTPIASFKDFSSSERSFISADGDYIGVSLTAGPELSRYTTAPLQSGTNGVSPAAEFYKSGGTLTHNFGVAAASVNYSTIFESDGTTPAVYFESGNTHSYINGPFIVGTNTSNGANIQLNGPGAGTLLSISRGGGAGLEAFEFINESNVFNRFNMRNNPGTTEIVNISGGGDDSFLAVGGQLGIGKINPAFDLDIQGDCNATAYHVGGVAGFTGVVTPVNSITVVGGIITAAS